MTVLTSDALRCILNGDLNSRLENNGLICSSKEGLEFPFNLDGAPMNISGSIFFNRFYFKFETFSRNFFGSIHMNLKWTPTVVLTYPLRK